MEDYRVRDGDECPFQDDGVTAFNYVTIDIQLDVHSTKDVRVLLSLYKMWSLVSSCRKRH